MVWNAKISHARNERRRQNEETHRWTNSKRVPTSGPPIEEHTRVVLRNWMETRSQAGLDTTIASIRNMVQEFGINHTAEQISKWMANQRTGFKGRQRREYDRQYRANMTEEQKERKRLARRVQKRQKTPSAAGPKITATTREILLQYADKNPQPSIHECDDICTLCNLQNNPLQLQRWFRNFRTHTAKARERGPRITKNITVTLQQYARDGLRPTIFECESLRMLHGWPQTGSQIQAWFRRNMSTDTTQNTAYGENMDACEDHNDLHFLAGDHEVHTSPIENRDVHDSDWGFGVSTGEYDPLNLDSVSSDVWIDVPETVSELGFENDGSMFLNLESNCDADNLFIHV